MHRSKLLTALTKYADRYPEESETTDRFGAFIESEPRCFERDCWAPGHVTGSAWLLDPDRESLLLTHHKKLDMWLQLGGHSDGQSDTPRVAHREATEESGLEVKLLSEDILDIDIHAIPARKTDPEHFHFDVRYCLVTASRNFVVSDESNSLSWVKLDEIESYTEEVSILRMRRKWAALV